MINFSVYLSVNQSACQSVYLPFSILGAAGTISGSGGSRIPGLRRLDSSGERSHRQLIDCIRSKDTDALIDAIDAGGTVDNHYLLPLATLFVLTQFL